MARLHLDRLRAHALRHEALGIRIDRPVLRGHGIPARLRSPCRVGRLIGKQCPLERRLNGVENARLVGRQVAAKSRRKASSLSLPSSPDQTMPAEAAALETASRAPCNPRRHQARGPRRRRRPKPGIDACLGHDHAGERMTDQTVGPCCRARARCVASTPACSVVSGF